MCMEWYIYEVVNNQSVLAFCFRVNWDDLKEIDGAISWQDMMYNAQSPDCVIPVSVAIHGETTVTVLGRNYK